MSSESWTSAEQALSSVACRFHSMVVNIFLEGFLVGLIALYFARYSQRDKPWIKWLVGLVGFASVAESATLWTFLHIVFVEHLYDAFAQTQRSSYVSSERALSIAVAWHLCTVLLVQGYFSRRAWLALKKSMAFGVFISLLILYVAGVGIALVYYLFNRVWVGNVLNTTSVGFYSGCVAIDIINTSILAYMLLSYRTQTTYQQTRSIITRYLLVIINSSALSTSFAIATLVLSQTNKKVEWYIATFEPLSKLYCLSLLVQLMTRAKHDGTLTRGDVTKSSTTMAETGQSDFKLHMPDGSKNSSPETSMGRHSRSGSTAGVVVTSSTAVKQEV